MIRIQEVLALAEGQAKRAAIGGEADIQKYVTELENEYLKLKSSAELEVANIRAELQAQVQHAETALASAVEARLHAIGRELKQDFEDTKAFVVRVFKGLPAHVQPGRVEPYVVPQEPPVVQSLSDVAPSTADRSKGVPDITK